MRDVNRRRVLILLAFILVGGMIALSLWLGGCARADHSRYEAGMVSKITAENTYQAIYQGYRQGQVSEADLALARTTYRAWAQTHTAYLTLAQTNQQTSPQHSQVEAEMTKHLDTLLRIASKYHLL
jgi:hypothetical protein